eukprot:gene21152-27406_t
MGVCKSKQEKPITPIEQPIVHANAIPQMPTHQVTRQHSQNIHIVNPDIKVHTVVSAELDFDHDTAMKIPLGEVSDEQLLAEVARRQLDLHSRITDTLVRETYEFGKVLGHGASGQVIQVTHKTTGDVHHFIANYQDYHEGVASRLMKQLLSGIHYLHSLGIVHRDLKLENILLSDNGPNCDVKIADFGLSALVRLGEGYDPDESSKRKAYVQLKEMWGTKEYFAPELVEQAYGPQADVWACGCILFEMCCGYQAFGVKEFDTEDTFYGRILRGEFDSTRPTWKKISNEARDLVHSMLTVDPRKRVSASEGLLTPWIGGKVGFDITQHKLPDAQVIIKQRLEARERRQKNK